MKFIRERHIDFLRDGLILKSTDVDGHRSLQVFIANEDFAELSLEAQNTKIADGFTLIESRLRRIAGATTPNSPATQKPLWNTEC